MTNAMSDLSDDTQLDVTVGTIKRMLIDAYEQYDKAFRDSDRDRQIWFDASIRTLHYVIEAHGQ